ncbi:MAG: serine/threonine protein phosphatase [Muricauda sp.]|uniref:metallophosphoesterase n=1 Tax=Flagellimonas lutaonensis TaxID=516051 RepID=UPI0005F82EA3|nr:MULTISPECIES: metallophosphoesterase [Allomuricauda]MBC30184.1 serine/threonine protein phosphatase [Allomuricauda sp.]|tara:strand:+ start:36084 stop:36809 length:726 start_codon:yes stop_codon:yes gene_type:complete
MRTLVVGDIHSANRALRQVLDRAAVSTGDKIIFLGDYVDGWSEAVETVDFLIGLKKTHNCIFIRGNHDDLCREWLLTREENPTWLMHGGQATKDSYSGIDRERLERHLRFYDDLENTYLDGENRLYLHAGFTNLKGIEHEYFEKMFYWDRTLWELAQAVGPHLKRDNKNFPQRLKNYHEIFIGHTPISKTGPAVPKNAANVWNVDTGAAFKGPLTIMDVETKQFWQSDPVHTLYTNENGRN